MTHGHGQGDTGAKNMPKPTHRTQGTPHVSKLPCSALPCPAPSELATACWSYAMLRLLTFLVVLLHLLFQNSKPLEAVAWRLGTREESTEKSARGGRILSSWGERRAGEASTRSTIPCLFPPSSSAAPHSAGRWATSFFIYWLERHCRYC
jgi:hypothetical protein